MTRTLVVQLTRGIRAFFPFRSRPHDHMEQLRRKENIGYREMAITDRL